jgi:hypothetical protein
MPMNQALPFSGAGARRTRFAKDAEDPVAALEVLEADILKKGEAPNAHEAFHLACRRRPDLATAGRPPGLEAWTAAGAAIARGRELVEAGLAASLSDGIEQAFDENPTLWERYEQELSSR